MISFAVSRSSFDSIRILLNSRGFVLDIVFRHFYKFKLWLRHFAGVKVSESIYRHAHSPSWNNVFKEQYHIERLFSLSVKPPPVRIMVFPFCNRLTVVCQVNEWVCFQFIMPNIKFNYCLSLNSLKLNLRFLIKFLSEKHHKDALNLRPFFFLSSFAQGMFLTRRLFCCLSVRCWWCWERKQGKSPPRRVMPSFSLLFKYERI